MSQEKTLWASVHASGTLAGYIWTLLSPVSILPSTKSSKADIDAESCIVKLEEAARNHQLSVPWHLESYSSLASIEKR